MVSLLVLSCFLAVIVAQPQNLNQYLPPSNKVLIPPQNNPNDQKIIIDHDNNGSSDTNPENPSPVKPNVDITNMGTAETKPTPMSDNAIPNTSGPVLQMGQHAIPETTLPTMDPSKNGYKYDPPKNGPELDIGQHAIPETTLPAMDPSKNGYKYDPPKNGPELDMGQHAIPDTTLPAMDPSKNGYKYDPQKNGPELDIGQHAIPETTLPAMDPSKNGYKYYPPKNGPELDMGQHAIPETTVLKERIYLHNDGISETNTRTPPNTHINEEKSGSQHPTQNENLEPIVTKSVYKFKAPIDIPDKIARKESTATRPEKHYRLVFITAPEYHNSAAQQTNAQSEEKTLIYVLSKQPDAIEDISTTASIKHSKPEVAFIKYKTHEEAEDIKKKLEAEHNGPTHMSEESSYKIINSILEEGTGKATTLSKDSGGPNNIDKTYLPSST